MTKHTAGKIPAKIFVSEYLKDFNATRAAKVCGSTNNYLKRSGSETLKRKDVQAELRRQFEKITKRNSVDQDVLVQRLYDIALCNISDVVSWKNNELFLKDSDEIPEEKKNCVKKIARTGVGLSIEFHDSIRAIELLGKHLGLFDGVEESVVQAAMKLILDRLEKELSADVFKEVCASLSNRKDS